MNSVIDNVLTSAYITMPDGVKIAADFWLPIFSEKQNRVPAIVRFTRYWRGYELSEDKKDLQPIHETAKFWNESGYAFVVVDTRGSGASFGYRDGEFSAKEINDLGNIVNYISRTEWCDGNVISEGTSYSANLALLSSITNPEPLRVVHGTSPDFDGYAQLIAPGGIQNKWLAETFSGMIQALDRNDWQEVLYFNPGKGGSIQPFIKGVRPVDGDCEKLLLKMAIEEHEKNQKFSLDGEDYSARDSSPTLQQTTKSGSLFNYIDEFTKNNSIVNYEVGWFDAGTVVGALAFFKNLNTPTQIIIGPWNHGSGYYTDPLIEKAPRYYSTIERLTFLREMIDNAQLIGFKKTIVYYTLGRNKWQNTSKWPIDGVTLHTLFLANGHRLAEQAPGSKADFTDYPVDLTATTGVNNRWHTQIGAQQVLFPNRDQEDNKLLIFDSDKIVDPLEITGEIELELFISVNDTKGAIFAYFELVAPDGEVILLTETQVNLAFRARSTNPAYKGLERNLLISEKQEIFPHEVIEIQLKMLPLSVLVPAGHKIRIAFAGADCDTFTQINDENTVLKIMHDSRHKSCVRLPVKKA